MRILLKYGLIFFFILLSLGSKAQFDPDNVCRVENGRIIFKLDIRWTDKQKKEISTLFDLDSLVLAKAYNGAQEIMSQGISWKVKKIKPFYIELSIPVDISKTNGNIPPANTNIPQNNKNISKANKNYVLLMDDSWVKSASAGERESAVYGINNFAKNSVFQYKNGIANFYLPGFRNARKVYLAGAFNNWSTTETPMQVTDSGWVARLKLLPGKYSYKYIADGRWMTDPNNKHNEDDGYGNTNSIMFCYNYNFVLRDHQNAKKVFVAGSFNNWNRSELRMNRVANGWDLPLYLNNGTHTYKFIVDNEWMTDPANKQMRNDGSGNYNSVLGLGDAHLFVLKGYTADKLVVLAGNFNGWNSGELVMNKIADGWQLPYVLAPGNYEYKFVVDGKWITDPANPYTIGSGNLTNSVLAFKENHIFTLSGYPNAKNVIVTGNFNNWSTEGYRMAKKNGEWIFPIYLRPGKCTYKFIIDGNWVLDPGNKIWEENEYGTGNSVLWINADSK